MIFEIFAPFLLAQAAATPVPPAPLPAPKAEPITLTAQQRASVRCAATFALVSQFQTQGNAEAMKWPALGERGREFFVQTTAQIMDEQNISRAEISDLVKLEAEDLMAKNTLYAMMPACTILLNASGV